MSQIFTSMPVCLCYKLTKLTVVQCSYNINVQYVSFLINYKNDKDFIQKTIEIISKKITHWKQLSKSVFKLLNLDIVWFIKKKKVCWLTSCTLLIRLVAFIWPDDYILLYNNVCDTFFLSDLQTFFKASFLSKFWGGQRASQSFNQG